MTHILKIQINAHLILKKPRQKITLAEAFPFVFWSKSAKDLAINFNHIDDVMKSVHQIPGEKFGNLKKVNVHDSSTSIDLTKGTTFLINCDKAPSFDACLVIPPYLFAVQFKHTLALALNQSTISAKDLHDEITKSKDACSNCVPELKHIFLAISNRSEKNVPSKKISKEKSNIDTDYDESIESGVTLVDWVTKECQDNVGLVFKENFEKFCATFSGFSDLAVKPKQQPQSIPQNPRDPNRSISNKRAPSSLEVLMLFRIEISNSFI
jgi:hypothetical protein